MAKKLNGKIKLIGVLTGIAALVLTLCFSLGGCWNKLDGRVDAVEIDVRVQQTKSNSIDEKIEIIRQDVRDIKEFLLREK